MQSEIESFLGSTKSTGEEKVYNCPNGCGPKLYVNYRKQRYFCQKCGYDNTFIPGKFSGKGNLESLYKYFKHEPLPVSYVKPDIEPTKPFSEIFFRKVLTEMFRSEGLLSEEHKEYLAKRGFKNNEMHCASASHCKSYLSKKYTKEELKSIDFITPGGTYASWLTQGKLLVPYVEWGLVTGVRARSMLEVCSCRYIWAKNNKASLRVYNHDLLSSERILIWTEGEFKAGLATLHGYPTIATAGVSIGHNNLAFNLCRYNTKFVYICFDTECSSSKSEADVNKAFTRASKLLTSLDIPHKRVIIPSSGGKMDLDTYILENGPQALHNLFPLISNRNRLLHRTNLSD